MEPSRIYGGNAILVRCVLRFVRNEGDLHLDYPCNNKTFFLVNCLQFCLMVDSSRIQVNCFSAIILTSNVSEMPGYFTLLLGCFTLCNITAIPFIIHDIKYIFSERRHDWDLEFEYGKTM